MPNPIVPESALNSAHRKIVDFAVTHWEHSGVDLDGSDVGTAFVYYLFFSRHPSVDSVLGVHLNEEEKFYNAYYWFRRFVTLRKEKHGYDAGLEQQAFKMLEEANFDLDFEVIEMLDKIGSGGEHTR